MQDSVSQIRAFKVSSLFVPGSFTEILQRCVIPVCRRRGLKGNRLERILEITVSMYHKIFHATFGWHSLVFGRSPYLASVAIYLLLAGTGPALVFGEPLECIIKPYQLISVGTGVQGVIDDVFVKRGDQVEKGQVLATLESSVQKVAVKLARARAETEALLKTNLARLEFGQRRLTRTQELFENEISSLSELDEAETGKLLAELGLIEARDNQRIAILELERSQAELALRTISSPITGTIIQRFLSKGELANNSPIVQISQLNPLIVEVFSPVTLLGKITVGMEAKIKPENPVGGEYVAKVTMVDSIIDIPSRTYSVQLELPNLDYALPAGLKCQVEFLWP